MSNPYPRVKIDDINMIVKYFHRGSEIPQSMQCLYENISHLISTNKTRSQGIIELAQNEKHLETQFFFEYVIFCHI